MPNKMGILTRKYMLDQLRVKKDALIDEYKSLINNVDKNGRELSYASAAFHRSKAKKHICTLTLIEELLYEIPVDGYIENDDSVEAFMRLIKE